MTHAYEQGDGEAQVWQRHPALSHLIEMFPGLVTEKATTTTQPPVVADLQQILDDAACGLQLSTKVDRQRSYEEQISAGILPTRPGHWHDVFNALAFACFPKSKLALHGSVLVRQRERKLAGESRRTRVEDTLTLLDEATLLLCCPQGKREAWTRIRRSGDFLGFSALFCQEGGKIGVLGHALQEHLVHQRPEVGAGGWILEVPACRRCGEICYQAADEALALEIASGCFQVPCFGPSVPWPHEQTNRWMAEHALFRCRAL